MHDHRRRQGGYIGHVDYAGRHVVIVAVVVVVVVVVAAAATVLTIGIATVDGVAVVVRVR